MLSQAIMSVVQVFPSFVILSMACIFVRDGLISVEMWFDRSEDRCCGLSKVGMVETVGFYQVMWFVMLESAKDRILGVDTPRQHVPPRVRYRTTCLLIRYAIGYVLCLVEWVGTILSDILCELPKPHGTRGDICAGNLSTACGDRLSGKHSKAWHIPIVDLCNIM
jgi:hypothetical protein